MSAAVESAAGGTSKPHARAPRPIMREVWQRFVIELTGFVTPGGSHYPLARATIR